MNSSPDDKAFLKQLNAVIQTNLQDEGFGVTELAAQMKMSRSTLYFRVKSITGKSVSKYMREVRLEKGMELLKEGTKTVSEVAYDVGFNSSTYFITCFHNYFGFPPGDVKDIKPRHKPKPDIDLQLDNPAKSAARKFGNFRPVYLFVLIVIVLAVLLFIFNPFSSSPEIPEQSLAVLPFKNLSEEQENRYFADGVMESIMENLSRINDLKLVSRTSVDRYRENTNRSVSEIASELEVAYILEGSVQKSGDQIRIWVKLIKVGSHEEQIWSEQYDRHISDLFKVQNEIAQQVAISLRIILTPEERIFMDAVDPTKSMEAWDLLIRAQQSKKESRRDYVQAIEKLKEALQLDPEFGRAYCYLGGYLYKLREFGIPESVWRDSALAMIQLAAEINPERSRPYRNMANIYKTLGEDEKEYQCYIKGLENQPNDYIIMRPLAHYYERKGEFEAAVDMAFKGLTIDVPTREEISYYEKLGKVFEEFDVKLATKFFQKSVNSGYSTVYSNNRLHQFEIRNRDFKKALEYAERMNSLAPKKYSTNQNLAYCYMLYGEYENADEFYAKAERIMEQGGRSQLNINLHWNWVKIRLGKVEEGKAVLSDHKALLMEEIAKNGGSDNISQAYQSLAMIHAYEGDMDGAIKSLQNWISTDEDKRIVSKLQFLLADPFMDLIRDDERFQSIVQKLLDKEAENKKLLRKKLKEYHKRNELEWLRI